MVGTFYGVHNNLFQNFDPIALGEVIEYDHVIHNDDLQWCQLETSSESQQKKTTASTY